MRAELSGVGITALAHRVACYTATMEDTVRHGALQSDEVRHTLTVRDVEALLAQAGVQRSHRHVLRMCQSGMLDGVKSPGGPTGDEWLIAPASVPKAIGDLKYFDEQRGRRSASQPATSHHVADEEARKDETVIAGRSEPQPAVSEKETSHKRSETEPAAAGYVEQLTKRIDEKDEVIGLLKGQLTAKDQQITELSGRFTSLSDRFADTQKLMGAMQRMLAPLLGQSDPYNAPDKREAEPPTA